MKLQILIHQIHPDRAFPPLLCTAKEMIGEKDHYGLVVHGVPAIPSSMGKYRRIILSYFKLVDL